MTNTQNLIIASHTSQEQVDRAYQVMCVKYRDLIKDYYKDHKISLTQMIEEAGCPNPDSMHNFIIEGNCAITGKDLERLLNYTGLVQRFGEEVPVHIGSEVCYPVALCGTSLNSKTTHRNGSEVPEAFDKFAKKVISRTNWFYVQASQRFLEQQK